MCAMGTEGDKAEEERVRNDAHITYIVNVMQVDVMKLNEWKMATEWGGVFFLFRIS